MPLCHESIHPKSADPPASQKNTQIILLPALFIMELYYLMLFILNFEMDLRVLIVTDGQNPHCKGLEYQNYLVLSLFMLHQYVVNLTLLWISLMFRQLMTVPHRSVLSRRGRFIFLSRVLICTRGKSSTLPNPVGKPSLV